MRLLHFLTALIYGIYLTYVGLLLIVVPWSDIWTTLITRMPPALGTILGAPGLRGAMSAFGVLHFVVAFLEVGQVLAEKDHV